MTAFNCKLILKITADTAVNLPGVPHDDERSTGDHHAALLTAADLLYWLDKQLSTVGIRMAFGHAEDTHLVMEEA
jgi:hypothetical protein